MSDARSDFSTPRHVGRCGYCNQPFDLGETVYLPGRYEWDAWEPAWRAGVHERCAEAIIATIAARWARWDSVTSPGVGA
jgi:hypothetical protein